MLTKTQTLTKNTAVVETALQNDLLVYDPVLRTAYVLNATAAKIWEMLGQRLDKQQINDGFRNAFGDGVTGELDSFWSQLEKSGLVFEGEGPAETVAATAITFEYSAPKIEAYSEEFLRAHLNDEGFATFHDDTYSDIATTPVKNN